MTRHDQVYALFVAANPVSSADWDDLTVPDPAPLLGTTAAPEKTQPVLATLPIRRRWAVAVTAFVAVLVAVGVSLAVLNGSTPSEPVAPSSTTTIPPSTSVAPATTTTAAPDPVDELSAAAVAAAQQFLALLNSGDIDAVMALSAPDAAAIADRRVHEFMAAFAAAGMPLSVGDCQAEATTASSALVSCEVTLGDAVASELGPAEAVYPFRFEEGLLTWRPFEGIDIGEVNRAYATYLQAYLPEEYSAVCSPSRYDPLQIVQSNLLAITGECGVLAASAAADVAAWISAGRPDPAG